MKINLGENFILFVSLCAQPLPTTTSTQATPPLSPMKRKTPSQSVQNSTPPEFRKIMHNQDERNSKLPLPRGTISRCIYNTMGPPDCSISGKKRDTKRSRRSFPTVHKLMTKRLDKGAEKGSDALTSVSLTMHSIWDQQDAPKDTPITTTMEKRRYFRAKRPLDEETETENSPPSANTVSTPTLPSIATLVPHLARSSNMRTVSTQIDLSYAAENLVKLSQLSAKEFQATFSCTSSNARSTFVLYPEAKGPVLVHDWKRPRGMEAVCEPVSTRRVPASRREEMQDFTIRFVSVSSEVKIRKCDDKPDCFEMWSCMFGIGDTIVCIYRSEDYCRLLQCLCTIFPLRQNMGTGRLYWTGGSKEKATGIYGLA